jgi:hypothetical protein
VVDRRMLALSIGATVAAYVGAFVAIAWRTR